MYIIHKYIYIYIVLRVRLRTLMRGVPGLRGLGKKNLISGFSLPSHVSRLTLSLALSLSTSPSPVTAAAAADIWRVRKEPPPVVSISTVNGFLL